MTISTAPSGKPAMESGSTWGGPPPAAAAAAAAIGGATPTPISKGYREEMEDFAYCIRQWESGLGYKKKTGEDGKEEYVQRLPKCHGEVAMADAIIALTSNLAMARQERIVFNDDWFNAESTAIPEKK
jgi:hypothetical protein